jgi:hypothetical protein
VILFFCFFSLLSLFSQQGKETKKKHKRILTTCLDIFPKNSSFLGEYLAKRKTELLFWKFTFFSVDSRKNANFFGENLPTFETTKLKERGK